MNQGVTIAAAVAGGYVLGRTKKGKKAITLALWLAGKNRATLVRAGLSRLTGLPATQEILDQVRGPLVEAVRHAAISTFENRVGDLSAAVRHRTQALSAEPGDKTDKEDKADRPADDTRDEAPVSEKRRPASRGSSTADRSGTTRSTAAARRTSSRAAGSSTGRAKPSDAAKSGTSEKGTSEKGTSEKGSARKRSASKDAAESGTRSRTSTGSRSAGTRSRTASRSSSRSASTSSRSGTSKRSSR